MTTSSSVNFSMTRNEIITDALMLIGALGADEALQATDIAIANRALNRLIKAFENQAIHIWKRSEATVFLQAEQESYTFGTGSTDYATESYTQTTLSAAEASGQTVISVSSVTGITVSDYVGIVLDDGTLHWSTVSVVGASTITINDGLADDAASGAYVFAFTTKINKPLDILNVRRNTLSSDTDLQITKIDYAEYQNLPNKTETGTPIQWTYARKTATGTLYIWQPPSDISHILKITYSKPLEDFDAATDNPDLPQEWYDALVYQLAVRLAPLYRQTGSNEYKQLKEQADIILAEALNFDTDSAYLQFVPKVD